MKGGRGGGGGGGGGGEGGGGGGGRGTPPPQPPPPHPSIQVPRETYIPNVHVDLDLWLTPDLSRDS